MTVSGGIGWCELVEAHGGSIAVTQASDSRTLTIKASQLERANLELIVEIGILDCELYRNWAVKTTDREQAIYHKALQWKSSSLRKRKSRCPVCGQAMDAVLDGQ